MKARPAKRDRYIDFIKDKPPEMTRVEIREGLKAAGFWSLDELENAVNKLLDRDVRNIAREVKFDREGNVIERVHVARKTEDGVVDFYVHLPFLNYDDADYAIGYRVERSEYFRSEAIRIYEYSIDHLSRKDARRLRGKYQGVFDFAAEPTDIEIV